MATLEDVRLLQKRARDKEYRIRKQGEAQGASKDAIKGNVAKVSPRVSWRQVEAMSAPQLNAYARKLNNFNKKGQYFGSASGDVIPKKFLTQANKLIQKHNKFVVGEANRIQGIAPDLWEQYRVQQKGILKSDGIGGLLTPIDTKKLEPPRSLDVAKRRVKSFERRVKRNYDYYRKIQRKNMITQLATIGEFDLAELVRSMNSEQFDVLSSVLPIWQKLELEYYDPTNVSSPREDVRSYVYKAWGITSKEPEEKIAARLNSTFFNRDAAGRAFAMKALYRENKLVAAMPKSKQASWLSNRAKRRGYAMEKRAGK